MKHFLIMAGGTGGHVFPALAIAKYLVKEGLQVTWLGTKEGLESKIAPAEGFTLYTLDISGIRRKGWWARIKAPFQLTKAVFQAIKILKRLQPNVVVGMGGFAAGPGGLAAVLLGIPLVIHEQNAVAGFTNRVLSRFAKRVLSAFPGAFGPHIKSQVTGNPVRETLLSFSAPEARYQPGPNRRKILVLGGSQGALALNEIVPRALKAVQEENPELQLEIWHQSGPNHLEFTEKLYQELHLPAKVTPFIEEMQTAYAFADLAICRAGALTVSELAIVGLPAILIPFPYAVDDHQTGNAAYLSKAGAALTLQQSVLDPTVLAQALNAFIGSVPQLTSMAILAHSLAKREATQNVASICLECSDAAY